MHFPSRHPTSDPFPRQIPVEASDEAMDVDARPHRRLSFQFRSLSKRHSSTFLSAIISPHPSPDLSPPLSPPHKHNVLHRKSSAPPISREKPVDEEERHRYRILASTSEGERSDGGAFLRRSDSRPPPSTPPHPQRTRRFSLFRRSTSGKRPHLASGSEEGSSLPPPVPPLPTPPSPSIASSPTYPESPYLLDRATFSPTFSPTPGPFSPKHSPPPSPPLTPPLPPLPPSSLPSSPVLHTHDLPPRSDSPLLSTAEPSLHEEESGAATPRETSETAETRYLHEAAPLDSAKEDELPDSASPTLFFVDEPAGVEEEEAKLPRKCGELDKKRARRDEIAGGEEELESFERFPIPPSTSSKPVEQDPPTPFPPVPSPSPALSPSFPTQSKAPPRPTRRAPSPLSSLSPSPTLSPSPPSSAGGPFSPAVLLQSDSPLYLPEAPPLPSDPHNDFVLSPSATLGSTAQREAEPSQAVERRRDGEPEEGVEGAEQVEEEKGGEADQARVSVEPETGGDVATPVTFERALLALPIDDAPPSASPFSSPTPATPLADIIVPSNPSGGLPAQIAFPHFRARVVSLDKSCQDFPDGMDEGKEAKAEDGEGEGLFVGEDLQKQRAIAALVALLW